MLRFSIESTWCLSCFHIFRNLASKLHELKSKIQKAVVDRVVEDFVDITTPLKQFTDAVLEPEGKKKSSLSLT